MNFKEPHYEINEPFFIDIVNDIEKVICQNLTHQRKDIVKRRWLIGQKISLEEVRFFRSEMIPLGVLKVISERLQAKYGNEYSLRNLQDDYLFYNEHLNLFKQYNLEKYRPLSWCKYQAIMSIPDYIDRRRMEFYTREYHWTLKDLKRQIKNLRFHYQEHNAFSSPKTHHAA